MYFDTNGKPTWPGGVNIHNAKEGSVLWNAAKNGDIVPQKIWEPILKKAMHKSVRETESVYGRKDFRKLPLSIRQGLSGLTYNVGPTGLKKFKKTLASLKDKDYKGFIKNYIDAKRIRQVGKRRVRKEVEMMLSGLPESQRLPENEVNLAIVKAMVDYGK